MKATHYLHDHGQRLPPAGSLPRLSCCQSLRPATPTLTLRPRRRRDQVAERARARVEEAADEAMQLVEDHLDGVGVGVQRALCRRDVEVLDDHRHKHCQPRRVSRVSGCAS
eukprot:2033233-Rhodomonas_salina.3